METNRIEMLCRLFKAVVLQGCRERRGESYSGPYGEPLSDAGGRYQ